MMRSLTGYPILLATLLVISCTPTKQSIQVQESPKNIILLIGDGMGLTQVSSSYYYMEEEPNFSRFPQIGLIQTHSSSHKITDSAASATAYSAGVKTYNGAIGVDPDTVPVETIVEILAPRGYKSGLISTSSITHATPASFYAHTASRNSQEEIAKQLASSAVDFFAGGGTDFFARRQDGENYLDILRENDFEVDTTSLPNGQLDENNKYAYLLKPSAMPKMQEGRGNFLPKATGIALNYLSKNKAGFFLMVEGSQIDWGGHANDGQYIIEEVKDFNEAIGVALDFAEKDGNTLVVVTADHETGGFALSSTSVFGVSDYDKLNPTFSTGGHTSTLVPVFAYGPGAEKFSGVYQNIDIFHKMTQSLRVEQ